MVETEKFKFIVSAKNQKTKLLALGRLCTHWSLLEQRIDQVTWALKRIDRKSGRKITANLPGAGRRIKEMKKAAKARFGESEEYAALETMAEHPNDLAEQRNWFVHGLWGRGTKTGMRRRTYAVSYFRNNDGVFMEVSVSALVELIRKIDKSRDVLARYIEEQLRTKIP